MHFLVGIGSPHKSPGWISAPTMHWKWLIWTSLSDATQRGAVDLQGVTVDGRNPAPVDGYLIPLFTRCFTSQVVQDFFHQQYDSTCRGDSPSYPFTIGHLSGFYQGPTTPFIAKAHLVPWQWSDGSWLSLSTRPKDLEGRRGLHQGSLNYLFWERSNNAHVG